MILVARGLGDPADFGVFTLVYSALLFANLLQMSLVTQPHNVLGTARHGRDYARYTTSTLLGQLLMLGGEGLLALAAAAVALAWRWPHTSLLVALAPSIVFWQLQEFFRRVLYTEGRHRAAFANDLISYGGQTVVIAVLWYVDLRHATHVWLTGTTALYALAATSAAAAAVGAWQARQSLALELNLSALRPNWDFGKWLAGAEILTWCSSIHLYLYLAAKMLGTAATGDLKAAQILFGPTRVFAYFLCTVLPIRFARTLMTGGEPALRRGVNGVLARMLPPLALYCLACAIFARPILRLSFGDRYLGAATALALYSGYAFLSYTQMVFAAALAAKRETRLAFFGSVGGAIVSLASALLLIPRLGTAGVLVAMTIASAVITSLYLLAYHRTASQPSVATPVEAPCPT